MLGSQLGYEFQTVTCHLLSLCDNDVLVRLGAHICDYS